MAKKGITAVVAVVLLLMMTVAAAGLAYMWIMNTQKDVQANTNTQLTGQQNQMQAKISIDSVWRTGATGITFTLRNSGQYAFPDSTLANFKMYSNGQVINPTPTIGTGFNPGVTKTVTFPAAIEFPSAGQSINIKVVSDIGASAEHRCAPITSTDASC